MTEEGMGCRPPSPAGKVRSVISEGTFAGMGGKEENAPIPAVRPTRIELVKLTKAGPRSTPDGKASVISGVPLCHVFLRSANKVPLDYPV
jgi:hypothetical protein